MINNIESPAAIYLQSSIVMVSKTPIFDAIVQARYYSLSKFYITYFAQIAPSIYCDIFLFLVTHYSLHDILISLKKAFCRFWFKSFDFCSQQFWWNLFETI